MLLLLGLRPKTLWFFSIPKQYFGPVYHTCTPLIVSNLGTMSMIGTTVLLVSSTYKIRGFIVDTFNSTYIYGPWIGRHGVIAYLSFILHRSLKIVYCLEVACISGFDTMSCKDLTIVYLRWVCHKLIGDQVLCWIVDEKYTRMW